MIMRMTIAALTRIDKLMILMMTTVTLMMIVALKMFAALTDDHDYINCHSDDDCRSG